MDHFQSVLNNWTIDEAWIEQAKNAAAGKDLVTLDIFDTCLVRDVASPIDIFAKIEKELLKKIPEAKGFAQAREEAEKAARDIAFRKQGPTEITFEQIYEQIPCFIQLSKQELLQAQKLEYEIEAASLYAVPDLLAFTKYLQEQNIPYSFVSDMYLPEEFLMRVLKAKGFKGWRDLIVSCQSGKTKHHGDIWRLEALRHKSILHIGDNKGSDVEKPKFYGINTLLYKRAVSQLRTGYELCPAVLPFSKQYKLELMKMRADPGYEEKSDAGSNYMRVLGASFGVLMLGTFTLWLKERCEQHGITHIAFGARDGALVQKCWKLLAKTQKLNTIKDSYLYVSRKVLTLAAGYLDSKPHDIAPYVLNLLRWYHPKTSIRSALEAIGFKEDFIENTASQYFKNLDASATGEKFRNSLHHLLGDHSEALFKILQQHYESMVGYLKQEDIFCKISASDNLGFFDMGWNGTMQQYLVQIAKSVKPSFFCTGFYYGLWPQSLTRLHATGLMESCFFSPFKRWEEYQDDYQGIDVLEELHTANEGSVCGFKKTPQGYEPICDRSPLEEEQFDRFIGPFQEATLQGLEALYDNGHFGGLTLEDLTQENALAAYYLVSLSPTDEEVELLLPLYHAPFFDHNLSSKASLPVPQSSWELRSVFKKHNDGWTLGLLRYWQLHTPKNKRALFASFAESALDFLDRRVRTLFERN